MDESWYDYYGKEYLSIYFETPNRYGFENHEFYRDFDKQ